MKQWFPTPGEHDPLAKNYRSWSGKLGVWVLLGALVAMFGLVSLLVFSAPLSRNELGLLGGLRVEAAEDTTVFVGDRKVGSDTVDVVWNELLGATGQEPLALAIEEPFAEVDLASTLATPDAKVVWQAKGPTGTHRGRQDANFSFRQVAFERSGGQIDHVFVIECEFPNTDSKWRRLIIPIRTRQSGDTAIGYFPQPTNQGGGNVSRGMIPSRRDYATFELKLSVSHGSIPEGLSDKSSSNPLWTPPTE